MVKGRRVVKEHAEDLLGLPYPVMLHDGAIAEVDSETGEVIGVAVPDIEGLAAAVAMARCLMPVQLAPEEIRFLREVLELRSGQMADAIKVDPATWSRYESGAQGVGELVERLLRIHVCTTLADRVAMDFDPRMITGMQVRRRRDDEPWPEMSFARARVRTASAVGSQLLDQWEPHKLAA